MVRILNIENIRKVKKTIPLIENKIKIKFTFGKEGIKIKGTELNEFLTEEIVRAIDFGFDPEDALLLTNQDFILKFIDIKSNTSRNNLKDVRARIIGRNGKAKKTIENLSEGILAIKDNTIGLIVDSEHLDTTTQAIISLLHGTKHGTIFSYLERQNRTIRQIDQDDLGLTETAKKLESP